jgi:hypothetical protein
MIRIIEAIKKGKLELLKSYLDLKLVNEKLADNLGISLLHIAASQGQPEIVKYLLENGADPTAKGEIKNFRPYDLSSNKETRDTFRKYMALNLDQWDYKMANIPSPLTEDMELKQREKELERRRKERELKKDLERKRKEEIKIENVITAPAVLSASKKISLLKLSSTEKQAIGLTPEQRLRLDREKRFIPSINVELWLLSLE